jgi:seryl-tRNA synthetase
MLDIRLIREKPDFVRERLATRSPELSRLVDDVLKVDSERRRLETELQRLNAERNQLSKTIGLLRSKKESTADKEANVRGIGEEIARLNDAVAALDQSQTKLMLGIPNLPHTGATIGANADANPEVRVWGQKPEFTFQPIDHVE